MKAAILDIEVELPHGVLGNDELANTFPGWGMDLVAERTGVHARRIAADGETALDLATTACRRLAERHPALQVELDVLIFCTQTPDHVIPSNACLLHGRLGLPSRVGAFDVNLACSGFVYTLNLAKALISSGAARHVLLVTGDTYSKLVHPRDRAVRTLFGDAAAATWIGPGNDISFVEEVTWGTKGSNFDAFYVPAGGARLPRGPSTLTEVEDTSKNVRTQEHIHMQGKEMLKFTNEIVPQQVSALLRGNGIDARDVDLFVFHQASELVLDALERRLELQPEQAYRHLSGVGNTVSASIPMALGAASATGRLHKGDRVVLAGFGAGLSWANALLRF